MTTVSLKCRLLRALCCVVFTVILLPASAQINVLDRVGLTSATPAVPAYALRKLSNSYSGAAVQVRRSSDGRDTAVGFTAGGELDTLALKTFVGTANGTVTTWFDQSGNNLNATQADAAIQPLLVNSGIIERLNGKPALYFGAAYLATGQVRIYQNSCSMVSVAKGNSATPSSFVTKTGTDYGVLEGASPFDFTSTTGIFSVGEAMNQRFTYMVTMSSNPPSAIQSGVPASIYSFVINSATADCRLYRNGEVADSMAAPYYADLGGQIMIGARLYGPSSANFWTPELILFNQALSATERSMVENSQNTAYSVNACIPFEIASQPVSDTVCGGASHTLAVVATGANLSYQWRRNGSVVGGNDPFLSIPSFSAAEVGAYTCTITNSCMELTTSPVSRVLLDPAQYPLPMVAGVSSFCNARSTVLTASGPAGFSYRWYANSSGGAALVNGPLFTTPVITSSTQYYVTSVRCGSEGPRRPVPITVIPSVSLSAPGPVATPAIICVGQSALSALADTALGQLVYWYDAPTGGNLLGITESGDSLRVSLAVTTTYYAQSGPRKTTVVFNFTGHEETFTVPAGVSELEIEAYGAAGGGRAQGKPGLGGLVKGNLDTYPGAVYGINVGQNAGGFGGGGGTNNPDEDVQSNGGGATDLRARPGGSLTERLIVAGGGGGGYFRTNIPLPSSGFGTSSSDGGAGGGLTGSSSTYTGDSNFGSINGSGGTQTSGGWYGGGFGSGFGGGGGGWYGGGGYEYHYCHCGTAYATHGGGGGSSYTHPQLISNVTHAQGVNAGHGKMIISYTTYPRCLTPRMPVTVTVGARPTVSASTADYSCPGTTVTLTASGADTYVWQPGSLTGSSIAVAPGATTEYTVVGTINNSNCIDTAVTVVSMEPFGISDTVCVGANTSASVPNLPAGSTVRWYSGPGGTGTLLGTGATLPSLPTGTYYFQVQLPCGTVEGQPLTIIDQAQARFFAEGDSLLCPGSTTFLSLRGFGTKRWEPELPPVDAAPAVAQLAVGLRLLNSNYTGPLIRLRRATDDAEQNFGAVGRNLDTLAIRAWLGSSIAFCVTLYDQSGSGNNITQATPGAQPELILSAGTAGRPVLRFNTQQTMKIANQFTAPYSISITARQTGGARGRVLSGINNNWLLGWNGVDQARAYFDGWVRQSSYPANDLFNVYTGTSDGVSGALYENGIFLARGAGVAAPDGLQLNGWNGIEYSDCEIAELVVFGAVLPAIGQTSVESGALNYFIDPTRLLVSAPDYRQPKTYTATAVSSLCGTSVSTSITVRSAAKGDPAQYGSGSWNVYAWTEGGPAINAEAWSTGYSGFYNVPGLSFSTTASWPANAAPSSATGYQGCAVSAATHSWSAKRKGFPCDYYKIDVSSHEAAQLWINGSKVWEHDGLGDSHNSVWTGSLGASDSVEFRATRSGSGLGNAITLTPLVPTLSYPVAHGCNVRDTIPPAINIPGGIFSATPAGLSIDSATGVVNGGAAGNYLVSYTLPGCAGPRALTFPLLISTPVGDPTVYGVNSWSVYLWNTGGSRVVMNQTWVVNYSGFYTAAGLGFNSADQWASATPPSSAAGYQGCPVNADQNSWIARREGFPCNRYRIDVPHHDDGAYININGVRVWTEHYANNFATTGVWTGQLGPTDRIDFLVTQATGASGAAIDLIVLPYTVQLSYPASSVCTSVASFNPTVTFGAGVFSAAPAGLTLDTLTGVVIPGTSVPGIYTISYTASTPCGDVQTATTQLEVGLFSGDPTVFGLDEWRVHIWNSGDGTLGGADWSTNYSGYYTSAVLDFNTVNEWADGTPPSNAPGYVGCPVGSGNHSWSAKRKGFACGFYAINVASHADAAQLWVNAVKVFEHDGSGDVHNAAWQGLLGAGDSVEFRTTQGSGGSNGALQFVPGTLTLSFPTATLCVSDGAVSPVVNLPGGSFSSSPAGLSIGAATGIINPALSLPGTYTVAYEYSNPCTPAQQATFTIIVKQPAGNPAVAGINVWNVYAWAAGDFYHPTESWSGSYVGYIPAASTSIIPSFTYEINNVLTGDPSKRPTYQGCPITSDIFSWAAIRKGFACGRYELRVGTQDGSGELYVNGVLVYTFGLVGGTGSGVLWRGYLSSGDSIMVRGRSIPGYGGRMRLTMTSIGDGVSLSYPSSTGCHVAGNNETIAASLSSGVTGTYSVAPSGLTVDATTGAINLATSVAGTYTVSFTGTSVCGGSVSASAAPLTVVTAGNPADYGIGQWNVYAWNAGQSSGTPWSTSYAGSYTTNGLNFSTATSWDPNSSPSSAPGYQGCTVNSDNHSWSAKRTGFPCGYYTLSIPDHDDNVELWINGVRVFNHAGCCDAHPDIWSGTLGATDSIEFRCSDNVSLSNGSLIFVLQPGFTYSSWTGVADSSWTNAANWCGSVPDASTDVLIPASAPHQPIVYGGTAAMVHHLTLQSGSTMSILGTLNLYGDLTNSGGVIDMSLGRLDLEGSTRQQVPAFMVQTLNVNGGGGFILSGSSTVSGALNFGASGGTIVLGSSNLSVGSITGGDGNAFVVAGGSGVLTRKTLGGTQLLPVGVNASSYTPLTITSPEGLDWSVRLQGDFTGYDDYRSASALQRIWHITPSLTPTAQPADLVFSYPSSLWATPALITVFHYKAGIGWSAANGNASGLTAVVNGSIRSVLLSGQQSFSPFALGSTSTPLPVSLVNFSARVAGSRNLLTWQTASEQNNRGFSVERSSDGRVFSNIGFSGSQAPGGNSSAVLAYQFADSSFSGLRQFYRLRQSDIDGRSRFSNTVAVNRNNTDLMLSVYPNPAGSFLTVDFGALAGGRYNMALVDMNGRTLKVQVCDIGAAKTTAMISLSGIAAGGYGLRVYNAAGVAFAYATFIKE